MNNLPGAPEASCRLPWLINNFDVADAFNQYRHHVLLQAENGNLQIETSFHELLALSHILFLCRNQFSDHMLHFFGEDQLIQIYHFLLEETLDDNITCSDELFLNLSHVVNDVEDKVKTRGQAVLHLLNMAQNLSAYERLVVWGFAAALKKLPSTGIEDPATIGEAELTGMYFDPILSSILANPDENVILRWANMNIYETGYSQPDATITKLTKMAYGPSLGFGEAKAAKATCSNYIFCQDLLRLATFAKDTIDKNKLNASITFLIQGFNVTFFLTRLSHDGIYTMQEIGHLTFPRSIEDLHTFITLKNLNMLLKITDVFWRLCKPCDSEEMIRTHGRPTHHSLYSLVDMSGD